MLHRVVAACSYQFEILATSPWHQWRTEAFNLRPRSSLRSAARMLADLSPRAWVSSASVAARATGWGLQHASNYTIQAHTCTEGKFTGLLKYESPKKTQKNSRRACMHADRQCDTPAPEHRLKSIRWLIEYFASETAYGRMKVERVRLRGRKEGGPSAFGYWIDRWGGGGGGGGGGCCFLPELGWP